uniref:Uncharacterized protein n=1 Tax=Karlodinium veneficum TaxID=407301 RepID=A7WQ03_KARVE|nr:unknown [Karlodinium veneficum]
MPLQSIMDVMVQYHHSELLWICAPLFVMLSVCAFGGMFWMVKRELERDAASEGKEL